MSKPKFVKVDNELYEINTDFRIAIECDTIARDEGIGDYERTLAIIYKLFGEKGLKCQNQTKLIELGIKYLTFGNQESTENKGEKNEHEYDYNKCQSLISSSFKFDYGYDPYKLEYLHWYDFYTDLENLSTSEFGTCCALNRIMSIINQDASKIKENKDRQNLIDLQKNLIKKYCREEKVKLTEEQEESVMEFYKALYG